MRETAEARRESDAVANARRRVRLLGESLGTRHPDYASGLNQLALLLIMQGDADAAEPLLREALEIRREALGEGHPDLATSLSSLGGVLWARGELDQAEPLLRQAVEIRLDTLGAGHPKSVVSLKSLDQLLAAKAERESGRGLDTTPEDPGRPAGPEIATVAEPVALQPSPPLPPPIPLEADTPASVLTGGRCETGRLASRLEALAREFSQLGDRLTPAARDLLTKGVPPSQDVLDACAQARAAFDRLRDDVRDTAAAFDVRTPEGGLASLEAILTITPTLAAADAARREDDTFRRGSMAILDRLDRLSSPGDPGFAPLSALHGQAQDLRRTIETSPPGDLPPVSAQLIDGSHPLTAVLNLAGSDDSTSDEQWAGWYDAVARAFGTPLAVAVARGRVVAVGR